MGRRLLRNLALTAVGVLVATALTALIWAGLDWSVYVRVFNTAALWYVNIAILIPLVSWFVSLVPVERFPWPVFFAIQLAAAFAFAASWTGMAFLDLKIYADPAIEAYLHGMSTQYFNIGIFVYAAVAGWLYTLQSQRRAKEQAVREAELRRLAREAELKALKAQINPHFLFNTLNTVNALARDDPEGARSVNARLAGVIRYSLDGSASDFVTARQELDFVEDYLEIEKARLGSRLQFRIMTEGRLEDVQFPPMILQPLVENAIRHGVSACLDGGTIEVCVAIRNGRLECRVHDTGSGIGEERRETLLNRGVGLRNVVERLERIYENGFSFNIEGDSTTGCTVKVSFPCQGATR
jgi:signal transduction histidine kinase